MPPISSPLLSPDWKIERCQPWGKEIYWQIFHAPSGMYAPVSSFTFSRRKDAKPLVDSLNESAARFTTFEDLESRPADRAAIVSILATFKP